jgi:hypothetical protein
VRAVVHDGVSLICEEEILPAVRDLPLPRYKGTLDESKVARKISLPKVFFYAHLLRIYECARAKSSDRPRDQASVWQIKKEGVGKPSTQVCLSPGETRRRRCSF